MHSSLARTAVRLHSHVVRVLHQRTDRGATAVEYALMVSLVALVIIASVLLLGRNLSTIFNRAAISI